MLLALAVVLVCVGIVMVPSAAAITDGVFDVMLRQLLYALVGIGALVAMMHVDYHELSRPRLITALLAVTLVSLVAVYFFPAKNNANRWIPLGPMQWQPSELAKVVAIIFTAAVLARRMHRINDFRYALAPVLGVVGVLALLIVKQPDLGTSAVLVGVVFAMLVVAGMSWRFVAGGALLLLPVAAYFVVMEPFRWKRLLGFMDQSTGLLDVNYQVNQAKIALGSGGLFGQGLGNSVQKRLFLPEPDNDFIFAVIGEELGLVVTTLLVIAFVMIGWRGLKAALRAPDRFGTLLGIGLAMMVCLQALLNMSVVTGLVPNKGIPLPMISRGGSSLLMNLIAMGILMNISRQASTTAAASVEARPGSA
jgi:cell division protein FtsW